MRVAKEAREVLIERDGTFCQQCGDESSTLIVGHIIPQFIIDSFGYDRKYVFKNMTHFLELQCRKCDALQNHRIDWRNPKSKELLQELLDGI